MTLITNKKTRILVISHTFVQPPVRDRWIQFSHDYPAQVRLVTPSIWSDSEYRSLAKFDAKNVESGSFSLTALPTSTPGNHTRYLLKRLKKELHEFKPDIIYCVHEEFIWQLHQTILYRYLFYPRARLLFFSMRKFPRTNPMRIKGIKSLIRNLYYLTLWCIVKTGTDGALCHYPGIRAQMRSEGYKKPIKIGTQVGVNMSVFNKSSNTREQIRNKLGLSGFVIGYCGRLIREKGVFDILRAANRLKVPWNLLLVGDGPAREDFEKEISNLNLQNEVFITGRLPQQQIPSYFCAMDSFTIGSYETSEWIDTFPLVVAQAMLMKLPIIGSTSGAIPFQLNGEGLSFNPGDVTQLAKHLKYLSENPKEREIIGNRLFESAIDRFSTKALNNDLWQFFSELGSKNVI